MNRWRFPSLSIHGIIFNILKHFKLLITIKRKLQVLKEHFMEVVKKL